MVFVDGGRVIQALRRAGRINDLNDPTITTAPVLLGRALPLFETLRKHVALVHRATETLRAGFVQGTCTVVTST